jgi:four helix bundle protein
MKIERFEDLQCWQEARTLVNLVYRAIKESKNFQKDSRLCGQITSASVSSMSNIAEGFSRRSGKEFVQFLFISKSSTTEVQSEAYVALDQGYIDQDAFNTIYQQAKKVSKLNSGLITYLRKAQNSKLKKRFVLLLRTFVFERVKMRNGGSLVSCSGPIPSFRRKPESREKGDGLWISSLLYTS